MINLNKDELNCQEVVELVTDYLEQALLPEMKAAFENHLSECPGCDIYLEQVQRTIMILRKLAGQPLFPESREEVLEIFRNWKQE